MEQNIPIQPQAAGPEAVQTDHQQERAQIGVTEHEANVSANEIETHPPLPFAGRTREENLQEIKKDVAYFFRQFLVFHVYLCLLAGAAVLAVQFNLPYLPCIYLVATEVLITVLAFRDRRWTTGNSPNQAKMHLSLTLLIHVLHIIFLVLLFVQVASGNIGWALVPIPLYLGILFRIARKADLAPETPDYLVVLETINLFSFIAIGVQMFVISLRLQGTIDWDWQIVLFLFWLFIPAVLLGSSFILFNIMKQIVGICTHEFEPGLFKALLWMLAVAAGWTCSVYCMFISCQNYGNDAQAQTTQTAAGQPHRITDDKLEDDLYIVRKSLILTTVMMFVISFMTFIARNSMIEYWVEMFRQADEEEDAREQVRQRPEVIINRRPQEIVRKRAYHPWFLEKISASYFRPNKTALPLIFASQRIGIVKHDMEIENVKPKCSSELFTFSRINALKDNNSAIPIQDNETDTRPPSNEIEIVDLKEKQESVQCMICCSKRANAVIMECGHGGVCVDCATELLMQKKGCHLCRKNIKEILTISEEIAKDSGALVKVFSEIMIKETADDLDR